MKRALAVVGVLLLLAWSAAWIVIGPAPGLSEPPADPDAPWFEVVVERPRSARPLGGLLPASLFDVAPLRFDHASPGAAVVAAGPDGLELRADGWELRLVTDGSARPAAGTTLRFPVELANRPWDLRCVVSEDDGGGLFEASSSGDPPHLSGRFVVHVGDCARAGDGQPVDWPSQALTVRGVFAGLPVGGR